jgi:hypothetical protein
MTPQNIRARIESLLRLAEDPGATDQERALALDRVAELTQKYAIDASKLDPHSGQYQREDVVTHAFRFPTSYGLNSARGHGINQIIAAMGADGYIRNVRRGKGTEEEMVVFATESTMEVLKVLIPSLTLQENNACRKYIERVQQEPGIASLRKIVSLMRQDGKDPKEFKKHLDSEMRFRRRGFVLAFYVEAAERIRLKRKDAVQAAGRGYEVVLVDAAARIAQQMADISGLSRSRPRGSISADGWDRGTEAGRQAMVGQTEVHGGRKALGG